jgi:putative chitinase
MSLPLISGKVLQQICPAVKLDRADFLADRINFIAPGYGIETADTLREAVANIAHESGEFRIKEEQMSYKTAQRIVDIWPSRFNLTGTGGKKNANDFVKNPRKLANETYNGRMGNRIGTDDGYNFRGTGYLQSTGKEAALQYGKWWSIDPIELFQKARTEDWWAIDIAFWDFCIAKKLIPLSVSDERFNYIVKKINGGYIGLADRQKYFDRCKLYLK